MKVFETALGSGRDVALIPQKTIFLDIPVGANQPLRACGSGGGLRQSMLIRGSFRLREPADSRQAHSLRKARETGYTREGAAKDRDDRNTIGRCTREVGC